MFIVTFLVYLITSNGNTPYDYFTRLSNSFLSGKLYLTENPPWLNELVPVGNKYYVVYPPMPAILLVPIAIIFGQNTSQTLFSIFLGAVNVVLVFILIKRAGFSTKLAVLMSIFFGFGTNHWYLASIGSSWFIAHVVALFFLLLSLIEVFGQKRLWLVGLLFGASFWSRTPVIFTIPFFYIFLWKEFWPINPKNLINLLEFHLSLGGFIFLDSLYNFIRFGRWSPLAPYNLIPNIDKDPVFKDGFMNFTFIPRHLKALFLELPKIKNTAPFIVPSLYSTAIWLTSPAIIYALKFKHKLLTVACIYAIVLCLFMLSLWAGVGYAQWGYRFAQDFMPFILLLMALGIGNKPSKFAYILVALSVLINLWAVLLINKFGIYTI